jgi:hypothetical protein
LGPAWGWGRWRALGIFLESWIPEETTADFAGAGGRHAA